MARPKNKQRKNLKKTMLELQGGACAYCSRAIGSKLTLDHVFPHARGYRSASNVLGCCWRCNSTKGERMPNGCEIILLMGVNAKRGIALLPKRA